MTLLFAALTTRFGPPVSSAVGSAIPQSPVAAEDTQVEPLQDRPDGSGFAALLAGVTQEIAQALHATSHDSHGTGSTDAGSARGTAATMLATGLGELVSDLLADPGTFDPMEATATFVDLLGAFDLETDGATLIVLAENLARLDPEGVADFDASASDPVILIATLAELAEIPALLGSEPATRPLQSVAARFSWQRSIPAVLAAPHEATHDVSSPRAKPVLLEPVPQKSAVMPVGLRTILASMLASTTASSDAERASPVPMLAEVRPGAVSLVDDAARPTAPALPPPSGFARNLVQQIRSASFTGGQTRIALAPRGLGEIEIDMRPDESGRLRIILRAENPAVLQALRGDRDGLLLALSDGGAGVEDADLEFEDFSRRNRGAPEPTDAQPGRGPGPDDDETTPNPMSATRITATGTLDILT